jgi:hypothetical protein
MNTIRTATFGILAVLLATTAHAQKPVVNSGQSVAATVQRSVCYAQSATSVLHPAVRYRRPGGRNLGAGSAAVRRDGQQKCRSEPLAIGEGLLRSLKLTETHRIAGVLPRCPHAQRLCPEPLPPRKSCAKARRILSDSGNADRTDAAASTVASAPMVLAPVTVILMA